jgi:hypothetical protein
VGVVAGGFDVGVVFGAAGGEQSVDDVLFGESVECPVQHSEVYVGADLRPPTGVPGPFGGLDQAVDPLSRRGRLVWGEPVADQGGGAGARVQIQRHATFLHRTLVTAAPQLGVNRVQRPIQSIRQLFGGQPRRLRHEAFAQPPRLCLGQLPVRRVQVFDEHPRFPTVDKALPQRGEHQRQALTEGGGEPELPVGSRRGPGEPRGDLMGCPLEPLPGPRDDPRLVTGLVAGQLGHRDRVGDLHQVGEQLGLLVRQLTGAGLRHLDQPRVRDLLPRQRVQHGGQLRSGR